VLVIGLITLAVIAAIIVDAHRRAPPAGVACARAAA